MVAERKTPFFECKTYWINATRRISHLVEVGWLDEDREGQPLQSDFLGRATVKGLLPNGNSFGRPVTFRIPAKNICEAVNMFEACLAKEVAEPNKPKIV